MGRHLGRRRVRSRDGGITWEPRNSGVRADFNPDPYPVTGQCVHKFAMAAGEPETLYQQNHCGMYRSTDGGLTWTDLSANGLPSDFGFPLVAHPRDPKTFWIIPLNGADRGRFVPDASAAVWKTEDRGDTWQRNADGLPQHDAYLSVLREAMARDTLDPVGIAFGTKSGQLWHSRDEGRSWERITADLPEIWAVESWWSTDRPEHGHRPAAQVCSSSSRASSAASSSTARPSSGRARARCPRPGMRDRLVEAGRASGPTSTSSSPVSRPTSTRRSVRTTPST